MIKGAHKQMIVVRTSASRYFEEAYFVLKSSMKPRQDQQNDLLAEADRIIRESENARGGKRSQHRFAWGWFLAGSLLGSLLAVLICLLF
jgi:hypothetical protein